MLYIAYRVHYGQHSQPTDYEPNTYSGIAIFDDELDGLRYANQNGLKLIPIRAGQSLEGAIKNNSGIPYEPRFPIAEQVK